MIVDEMIFDEVSLTKMIIDEMIFAEVSSTE